MKSYHAKLLTNKLASKQTDGGANRTPVKSDEVHSATYGAQTNTVRRFPRHFDPCKPRSSRRLTDYSHVAVSGAEADISSSRASR